MASTIGKKFARKQVQVIKVCGHESINTDFPLISENSRDNGTSDHRVKEGQVAANKEGILDLMFDFDVGDQTIDILEYV